MTFDEWWDSKENAATKQFTSDNYNDIDQRYIKAVAKHSWLNGMAIATEETVKALGEGLKNGTIDPQTP